MHHFILPLLLASSAGLASGTRGHYSVDLGSWTDTAPIAIAPRQEHSTVAVNHSSIAIIGGIVPPSITTDLVQVYDIHSNQWRSLPPIPKALNHPNVAAVDGKIYVLGGLAETANSTWGAVSNCWVLDLTGDATSWRALAPLPAGEVRGSAAIGIHSHIIYLAGGMSVLVLQQGGEQGSVDTVSAFDTLSEKWVTLPEAAKHLPAPRDHVGGAVVGDTFYVLGGRDHGQTNVRDTVFSLELRTMGKGGWKTKSGRMPTARGGVAAAAVGTKVYTFGGEGNPAPGSNGVFNQTEAYDTETDTWERLAPMELPRHGTSAAAIGGRVYIPGGGIVQGGAPVNHSDVFWPVKKRY
ncbi:kelch domain-containing protein [Podospora didyma]|uniref:Kelch domain-containing protein n=1 Tax=Podospora didyma TaxID=330526 RepID=A0AAE0N3X0_9PEZI|nr:kelch domain-containing protein [Podospora didyma]